ncbi:MAG: class I SAM-dependent methyltransferase [Elusimicrobia bacterium]|nr:class I SAM-dependent methyltransferase [Elusimicrobiota bacterium]
MSLWSGLRVSWQAFKTRRKLNRQFGKREDPFSYSTEPYEIARLGALEAALGGAPLGRVLEAACAEGHFTERLARRASSVLALDISAVALARARRRAPSARFAEGDLMTWEPGPEAPFDAVVVAEVLYYLDRPGVQAEFEALFPRIASWLKPGGRLVMSHAFAGAAELAHRRAFRERFERAGLRLVLETIPDADRGGVRCLLSTLEKI